ncbi:MAG: 5'/3'-nucleotidase SurE [Verrucomicrobiales bacterium]
MIALVTNDDGIDALGLAALKRVAERFFEEVWVVAPVEQMSQIGHRVTTDEPIRYESRGERSFAVAGTPADCTRVALTSLLPKQPDWILSGINHGGNLGRHDFAISGTVAAVREGAFAGIRGIAVSHFIKRERQADWDLASERVGRVFESVRERGLKEGEFWNVNLPHPLPGEREPELVFCDQERYSLQVVYEEEERGCLIYKGDYHERSRRSGTDVDVCFGGDVAISRVSV